MTPPSIRKSLPVMKPPSAPMTSAARLATSSGVRLAGGGDLDHVAIALASLAGELILASGVMMMPLMVLIAHLACPSGRPRP